MIQAWRQQRKSARTVKPVRSRCRFYRARLAVELLEDRAVPATFVVNTTDDTSAVDPFDGPFDSFGNVSLRSALEAAEVNSEVDIIRFNIGPVGSSQTIQLIGSVERETDGELPDIFEEVFIDGWSQGGSGYAGPPLIEIDGSLAGGSEGGANGLNVFADNSVIRGLAINNFPFFGFDGDGIVVGASNVWIYGNYIGAGLSGTTFASNGRNGITLTSSASNVVIGANGDGSNDSAEANVIAGNFNNGIEIDGSLNTIAGNLIGVGADGSGIGNFGAGIAIFLGSNNLIVENVIAYNGQFAEATGVHVFGGTGNTIRGNSIFENVGLGIDLGLTGVTANDSGDADTGANDQQNFPTLFDATFDGTTLTIDFSVDSDPVNSAYPLAIDFYIADVDGMEGELLLGTAVYSAAQANSIVSFSFIPPFGLFGDDLIIATATDANGNTSEFSGAINIVIISKPPLPPVQPPASNRNPTITSPQEVIVGVGTANLGIGTVADPDGDTVTVTANFADGSPVSNIAVNPGNTFVITHPYAAEGTYTIILTVSDGKGGVAQSATTVYVLAADPIVAVTSATTVNGTGTATIPGAVTATLVQADPTSPPATILVAVLPNSVADAAPSGFTFGGSELTLATFDVRLVNASPNDRLTIIFQVSSAPGVQPIMQWINPNTGNREIVRGSTRFNRSFSVREIPGTGVFEFTVALDDTSAPRVADLIGTVFTFTVPRGPFLDALPNVQSLFEQASRVEVASLGDGPVVGGIPTTDFAGGSELQLALSSGGVDDEEYDENQQTVANALEWSNEIHRAAWSAPEQSDDAEKPETNEEECESNTEAFDRAFAEMADGDDQPAPDAEQPWDALFAKEMVSPLADRNAFAEAKTDLFEAESANEPPASFVRADALGVMLFPVAPHLFRASERRSRPIRIG